MTAEENALEEAVEEGPGRKMVEAPSEAPQPWYAGDSDTCNAELGCPAEAPWDANKQSVVQVCEGTLDLAGAGEKHVRSHMLVRAQILANHPSNGSVKCTGVLLNSASERQFVLTAGHCRRGVEDDAAYW